MEASLAARVQEPRVRIETERAVVEFDAGAMGDAEMRAFAVLVEHGIADIEAMVGPGPESHRRLRYVVTGRVSVSRTYGSTVLLPIERVRTGCAPYLHETAHALLPERRDWPWLSEGFASYLESWVSENRGGYDAHVFTRAGDRGIHRAALQYLSSAGGQEVLPYVGRDGVPAGLDTERWRVARPFYVLSHSLCKYLVDHAGLAAVVTLLGAAEGRDTLPEATGRGREEWRRAWLEHLGAEDRSD